MRLKSGKGFGITWVIVVLAVIAIVSAGYFIYQSNTDSAEDSDSTSNQETVVEQQNNNPDEGKETTGIVITTGDSEFGTMLFNDERRAIYIWELEESEKAECYGDCAEAWPPVLTNGAPRAAGSVSIDLLGTTKRTDGSTQVTYNGHPLYYYAPEGAGEVKCHNISTHGGLWWVIQPNGVRAE